MAYHQLEQLSRLYDGYMQAFNIDGHYLLLIQQNATHYLIENRCPHMDVALHTGDLLPDARVRCRSHGIDFSLQTGKAGGPLAEALDCLNRYSVAYEGSTIGVDL